MEFQAQISTTDMNALLEYTEGSITSVCHVISRTSSKDQCTLSTDYSWVGQWESKNHKVNRRDWTGDQIHISRDLGTSLAADERNLRHFSPSLPRLFCKRTKESQVPFLRDLILCERWTFSQMCSLLYTRNIVSSLFLKCDKKHIKLSIDYNSSYSNLLEQKLLSNK